MEGMAFHLQMAMAEGKEGQYPLLAPSVRCPQMVCGCLCLCVYTAIVRNKLICGYANLEAMSTFSPVGPRSSNGMRMCARMCVCALCWHIHISVHSVLCLCYTQARAHTHPQTI